MMNAIRALPAELDYKARACHKVLMKTAPQSHFFGAGFRRFSEAVNTALGEAATTLRPGDGAPRAMSALAGQASCSSCT